MLTRESANTELEPPGATSVLRPAPTSNRDCATAALGMTIDDSTTSKVTCIASPPIGDAKGRTGSAHDWSEPTEPFRIFPQGTKPAFWSVRRDAIFRAPQR